MRMPVACGVHLVNRVWQRRSYSVDSVMKWSFEPRRREIMKGEVWLSGSALIYCVGYSQHHKKKEKGKKERGEIRKGGWSVSWMGSV